MAKDQEQLHRGRLIGNLAELALPALATRVARTVAEARLFDRIRPPANVTISGLKGPDVPLFCAGSRAAAVYPVGPIAEGVGLNITVLTYLDQLHFGLLACRRLVPELDELALGLDDALGELVGCALDAQGAAGSHRRWRARPAQGCRRGHGASKAWWHRVLPAGLRRLI